MQAVVERAEDTHQRGGLFHAEMQMLRRVEDERRIEDGEAERREDLNEEERGRSLRSLGEAACEKSSSGATFVARRAGECQAAPAMLAVLGLQRVEDNAFHLKCRRWIGFSEDDGVRDRRRRK